MKRTTLYELLPEDELRRLYVEQDMTMKEIADLKGCSPASVLKMNNIYGIKARNGYSQKGKASLCEKRKHIPRSHRTLSEETKAKISLARKGKITKPSKFGGHAKQRRDGYIAVYLPNHPFANKEGYVMEHRLVMEEHVGRYLQKGEEVHHVNKKRNDNRMENLMLLSTKDHHALHSKELHANGKINHYKRPVINITTGEIFPSVKEAALAHNVGQASIRNTCLHKQKHARGCEFKYLSEYNAERNC